MKVQLLIILFVCVSVTCYATEALQSGISVTVDSVNTHKAFVSCWKNGKKLFIREIRNPHLWTPDDPYLYSMKVNSGTQKFPIRQVGREMDNHLLLNGKSIALLAGSMDDYLKLFGNEAADDSIALALVIMKRLGLNAVRLPESMISKNTQFYCDSIGLIILNNNSDFLFEEIKCRNISVDSLMTDSSLPSPNSLRITTDNRIIHANGYDVAVVNVELIDSLNNFIPQSNVPLSVTSNIPACFKCMTDIFVKGKAQIIVRSSHIPETLTLNVTAQGLPPKRINIKTIRNNHH